MARSQLWNAAAVVVSLVVAGFVVALFPPLSEAVEFLVFLVFFGASFWLLDRIAPRGRRGRSRARRP